MKVKALALGLISLLLMVGCTNKKTVTHLDHSTYDVNDTSAVCRSRLYDETRDYYDICYNTKVKTQYGIGRIDVFNTSLYVRYFADNLSTSQIEEIENIFGNTIQELHKHFDSNYFYLDENEERYHNVRYINQSIGKDEEIEISQDLYDILNEARDLAIVSRGRFNPFVGNLVDFWERQIDEAKDAILTTDIVDVDDDPVKTAQLETLVSSLPDLSKDDAEEVFDLVLELYQRDGKYYTKFNSINGGNYSITLGAIGKGYATERAKEKLIEAGYTRGMIYGGGSSISALGKSYSGDFWRLNIVNPIDRTLSLGLYNMRSAMSFSTSGDMEQGYNFRLKDGSVIRRHHIVDPVSGYPLNYYRSTNLETNISAGYADAITTVMMNLPLEGDFTAVDFIEDVKEFYKNKYKVDVIANYSFFAEGDDTAKVYANNDYTNRFTLNSEVKNVEIKKL